MAQNDLHHGEHPRRKLVTGQVANTPVASTDDLFVIIPSYHPQERWGPCAWTPHGGILPTAGTDCLVAFDENDLAWIVCWIGLWDDVRVP